MCPTILHTTRVFCVLMCLCFDVFVSTTFRSITLPDVQADKTYIIQIIAVGSRGQLAEREYQVLTPPDDGRNQYIHL